jgi:hypothetical protein
MKFTKVETDAVLMFMPVNNYTFIMSNGTSLTLTPEILYMTDLVMTPDPRPTVVWFVCFFYSRLSNFSAIWQLSPLPVTGLQI